MADGWNCPKCGSAHGPHVDTCPVADAVVPYRIAPQPVAPSIAPWWRPPFETTCQTFGTSVPADPNVMIWN